MLADNLADRWDQLGDEHQMVIEDQHDPWPRSSCWTHYKTRCSCGDSYPSLSFTDAQSCAHTLSMIHRHRHLHHMKHLVAQLLDEDWVPESSIEGWIPQEQA